MAHFAQIKDNVVQQVIVADQEFIDTLPDPQDWIQTSYNTRGGVHYDPETGLPDGKPALRKNYAFVGGLYDPEADAFYGSPQPFPSWVLDKETYLWIAPIPYPTDGQKYEWDEPTTSWILIPAPPNL